ncbi:MAG: twin-arginine translocase TatA/TatE family subunit [Chloroflexi bacterium]|nr:twin-arginine translocase TatA/TatE family subunit [Chloroflexota bacterium]
MPKIGPWELVIILVIVIAIFGAGKLAGLGGALGKGVKEFRDAVKPEDAAAAEAAKEDKKLDTPTEPKSDGGTAA